jgi:hypothetical protein
VFISLITTKLEQYGYTIAPTPYQPSVPQAAAESNARAAAAAAEALAEAQDRAAEAQEVYQYALGQPGEAGAAARLKEAEAAVTAAQKLVEEIQAAAVAAAESAAATAPLLQRYDVVVWKPKKKMTVGFRLLSHGLEAKGTVALPVVRCQWAGNCCARA